MLPEGIDDLIPLIKEYVEILKQMDKEEDDYKLKELYKKATEIATEINIRMKRIDEWLDEISYYLWTFGLLP